MEWSGEEVWNEGEMDRVVRERHRQIEMDVVIGGKKQTQAERERRERHTHRDTETKRETQSGSMKRWRQPDKETDRETGRDIECVGQYRQKGSKWVNNI